MSRKSFLVRIARRIQALPLWLLQCLEWPFLLLFARSENSSKALFVLALPRSGSTVTYQIICHGLNVQYLSNLWNLLYQVPLLGGVLSAIFAHSHESDFKSQHGFVSGLDGPAEGLRFWHWWLDCGLSDADCHTMPVKVFHRRVRYLNRVLKLLTRNGRPFASAFLGHTLVPDRLHRAFPDAVLIRIYRDPVSNALSLLRSKRAAQSSWFSVLPRECYGLDDASEHERVAAQVYWLNRRLDSAACRSDMLTVHYERLCQSPVDELLRIEKWCAGRGIKINRKFMLPSHFDCKVADIHNDLDARKIHHALLALEKRHGKLEENSA